MKKLNEIMASFKKEYNTKIIKVYKDTKELLAKYEAKMKRYGVPVEDSSQESMAYREEQEEVKQSRRQRQAAKKNSDVDEDSAPEIEYELPAKVINAASSSKKVGTIALKRKLKTRESDYE